MDGSAIGVLPPGFFFDLLWGGDKGAGMPKSSEEISILYRTIGSAMWLDGLTDEEIKRLDDDIISVFRKALAARNITPTRPQTTGHVSGETNNEPT